ncbi:type IV pilus modification PilV family protein [Pseudomonas sp. DSP3-2-2]|uniref:type IV pilus modification PilV family protein n=1 Tax=unclassified Pseudomonas TaxID=196821 RepID=UPI003CE7D2AA
MKHTSAGFGLLEMIAALVVLALGCTVLLVAFGQAARTLEQVWASDRLSLAARTLIDDQRDQPLQVGERSGIEHGVKWHLQVTRESGPAAALPLLRLQLTVAQAGRELRLSTLAVQSSPALSSKP